MGRIASICVTLSSSPFIFKTSTSSTLSYGLEVFPDMRPLHISLNLTHSWSKPSSSISSFTHSLFSSLPAHSRTSHPCHHRIPTGRYPNICTRMLHMPKPPQSTTPHHFRQTLNPQKTVQVPILCFLSFRDTPHIHLTIIRSVALPRLCIFSAFITHVTVPHYSTLFQSKSETVCH